MTTLNQKAEAYAFDYADTVENCKECSRWLCAHLAYKSGYLSGYTEGQKDAARWHPMESAPKEDGLEILALHKPTWLKEPERRIVRWNNGIDKVGFTWPCWMCAVTTVDVEEKSLLAWQPLPEPPEAK